MGCRIPIKTESFQWNGLLLQHSNQYEFVFALNSILYWYLTVTTSGFQYRSSVFKLLSAGSYFRVASNIIKWLKNHLKTEAQLNHLKYILLMCSPMMCSNNQEQYGPMVFFVCLYITLHHYHHYADVPEGSEYLKYLFGTFCPVCV